MSAEHPDTLTPHTVPQHTESSHTESPHTESTETLALKVEHLSVRGRGQTILEDISFELEEGGFLGLIGPNGAGKTVLLKSLLGLIRPSTGTVRIFGKPPGQARGLVSYVPQYASFEARFPIHVREVVLMGRLTHHRLGQPFSAEDRAIAEEALARLEISDLADRPIGELSGGQAQRALIARALAAQPKLLLLDEPTASLDSRIGKDVYQILSECAEQMTIILVSHDVGVISSYVKTIACLNRTLHYHHSKEISGEVLAEVYGCPVDLIAHGHAHRVLPHHHEKESS